MSTVALGKFEANVMEWRKLLATVPADTRLTIFTDAAHEIAGYINKGLPKSVAVDELQDMATAHSIDTDITQTIIADAFRAAEDGDRVPDWVTEGTSSVSEGKANGGQAAKIKPIVILSKADFVRGFIPPDYLIEGLLQRRFIYSLTGQTGHAKTAVALLLARLVSCQDYNTTLGPHRVDKGRVLYFVGENPDDVRMRVIGCDAIRKDSPELDAISFIEGVFNIDQMFGAIERQITRGGDVVMIIVDTSAAYFLGNEELSNTQMGAYARVLRKLTTLPGGPTVLVLCHPIKHVLEPSQLLPRGGGAYLAEVDGNLTLWRQSDEVVELYYNKMRGPGFQPISFKLETIRPEKLKDKKGRQLTTVQAVPISMKEEEQQTEKLEADQNRVLCAMLAQTDGSFSKWAEQLGWVTDSGAPYKKKVERCIKGLEKAKLTRDDGRGHWSLTDRGKDEARKAALRFERERQAQDQQALDL